jgi:hypothetical protein
MDSALYHGVGHAKQQLSQFLADELLLSGVKLHDIDSVEYVGMVDADSLLITPHTFDNSWNVSTGKPIIVVRLDTELRYLWYLEARKKTYYALQLPEMGRCMSFFPFYIRLSHLRLLREYVERIHGKPFARVFQDFSKGDIFSQFNIMCTYLWYFHREDYEWRYWKTSAGQVHLDMPEAIRDLTFLSEENTRPCPRSMIHWRHHHDNNVELEVYLVQGICHVLWNMNQSHTACQTTDLSIPLVHLFDFEQATWLWDPRSKQEYHAHYQRVIQDRIQHEPDLVPRLIRYLDTHA